MISPLFIAVLIGDFVGIVVSIKVVPQSGRLAWKLGKNDQLVCYLKAAPERGLANKEFIQFLSKSIKVAQADIILVAGAQHRLKKIKIERDITFDQLLHMLGVYRQINIFD